MKKEFKRIKKYGKKAVGKKHYKKIKKIKDLSERTESLKYLLVSKLKLEYLDLEHKLGKKSKESLLVSAKLERLKSKIKLYKSTHSEDDYRKATDLIDQLKTEIE